MAHNHDHDYNHDERELITLVDEQGNESLFEILLTIDGKEEFGPATKPLHLRAFVKCNSSMSKDIS